MDLKVLVLTSSCSHFNIFLEEHLAKLVLQISSKLLSCHFFHRNIVTVITVIFENFRNISLLPQLSLHCR